jgi:NADH:ubiquinone oxidoreductase subunit E
VKDKIKVTICSGTACFVMGGADLLVLEEHLPASLKGLVEITGSPCLEFCKNGSFGEAPFATIEGETIAAATIPILLERIAAIAEGRR